MIQQLIRTSAIGAALVGMIVFAGCNRDIKPDTESPTVEATTDHAEDSSGKTKVTAIKSRKKSSSSSPARTGSQASLAMDDQALSGPAVTISGKVTFWDGRPATSATVTASTYVRADFLGVKPINASATTDDAGQYKVSLDGEFVDIALTVTGDVPETSIRSIPVPKRAGGARLTRDIVLVESFEVKGRVLDEKGQPMPGISLGIQPVLSPTFNQDKNETRTNRMQETTSTASGEFTFAHIAPGAWNVGAKSPDYIPATASINVPTTDSVTLQFTQTGGAVTGRLLMKSDNSPVSGQGMHLFPNGGLGNRIIQLETLHTTTTAQGTFQFDHVSPGPQSLRLINSDNLQLAPGSSQVVNVADGQTTDITLYAYTGYTVQGTVLDKATSTPLAGAKIHSNKSQSTSDENGQYKLEHVFTHDTRAQLMVQMEGYAIDPASDSGYGMSVTIPDDQIGPVTRDIPMVRTITISGKVVSKDGSAIGHAQVQWKSRSDRGMQRDEKIPVKSDGSFKLESQPFTNGIVVAEAKGFGRGKSETITVTTEDVKDITITLEAGATIQGRVVDPNGAPVAGAEVKNVVSYDFGNYSTSSYEPAGLSGEDGNFTIYDVSREAELYAAKKPHADSERLKLQLQGGEVKSGVELKLRAGFEISGRVIRTGGQPVPNVNVYAYKQNSNSSANENTDKDGNFKLTGLAEGAYSVYTWADNKNVSKENVPTGTTGLELVIDEEQKDRLTLIGTVVDDATNQPVTDFITEGGNIKKTGKPGTFEYSGLQPNVYYSLAISSPNHGKQNFNINTTGKTDRFEQTFRLKKSGTITGRFVEKGTGKPLPKILVVNWGSQQFYQRNDGGPANYATSADDGTFTLTPVTGGANNLQIKPPTPLAEINRTVDVEADKTLDMGDIELGLGATVRGRVVKGASESPVPDKPVQLSSYSETSQVRKSTTTDKNGQFEFTGLSTENHSLSCGSFRRTVVPSESNPEEIVIRLGSVKVWGNVTRGGQPANARISATGPGGITISNYAQNGKYEMTDVSPGTYEFSAGGGPNPQRETVEIPDQDEFQKDFTLPDGKIRVTVTDSAGQPVPSAAVSLSRKKSGTGYDQSWLDYSTKQSTKADGTCQFDELTPGTYTVSANKNDIGSAMNPAVEVAENQQAEVALQLNNNGGTLVSIALSSATGGGIQEAWCYLSGPNGSFSHGAQRDSNGVMTITNIPPGTYSTNVSYWSHSQAQRQVEIKTGETVTIEDVLYPSGAITWTLRKADGTPANGATIQLTALSTNPPEEPRTGRTNAQGLYVERGLAPGTYQATATLDGKAAALESFTVEARGNATRETSVPGW